MRITTWVMSCRAFSRRIEFATLRELFENFAVDEIALEFKATPRQWPIGRVSVRSFLGPS